MQRFGCGFGWRIYLFFQISCKCIIVVKLKLYNVPIRRTHRPASPLYKIGCRVFRAERGMYRDKRKIHGWQIKVVLWNRAPHTPSNKPPGKPVRFASTPLKEGTPRCQCCQVKENGYMIYCILLQQDYIDNLYKTQIMPTRYQPIDLSMGNIIIQQYL